MGPKANQRAVWMIGAVLVAGAVAWVVVLTRSMSSPSTGRPSARDDIDLRYISPGFGALLSKIATGLEDGCGEEETEKEKVAMRSILLAALALLVACGGTTSSAATPAGAMSDDDQIFAVVFHELEHASLASGEGVCVGARGATSDGTALLEAVRSR